MRHLPACERGADCVRMGQGFSLSFNDYHMCGIWVCRSVRILSNFQFYSNIIFGSGIYEPKIAQLIQSSYGAIFTVGILISSRDGTLRGTACSNIATAANACLRVRLGPLRHPMSNQPVPV